MKYLLIKEYPESPPLGTVVNYDGSALWFDSTKAEFKTKTGVTCITEQPEYWKRIDTNEFNDYMYISSLLTKYGLEWKTSKQECTKAIIDYFKVDRMAIMVINEENRYWKIHHMDKYHIADLKKSIELNQLVPIVDDEAGIIAYAITNYVESILKYLNSNG